MAEAGASSSSGGSPAAKRKRSVGDDGSVEHDAPQTKKAKATISYGVSVTNGPEMDNKKVVRLNYSVVTRKTFTLGNYYLSSSETMKIGISYFTKIAKSVLRHCHAWVTGDESAKKDSWDEMKLHSFKFISLFHASDALDASESLSILTQFLKNFIL